MEHLTGNQDRIGVSAETSPSYEMDKHVGEGEEHHHVGDGKDLQICISLPVFCPLLTPALLSPSWLCL